MSVQLPRVLIVGPNPAVHPGMGALHAILHRMHELDPSALRLTDSTLISGVETARVQAESTIVVVYHDRDYNGLAIVRGLAHGRRFVFVLVVDGDTRADGLQCKIEGQCDELIVKPWTDAQVRDAMIAAATKALRLREGRS